MKGYIVNIEEETLNNKNFRRVLFTSHHAQLVVMSIPVGGEIGSETHTLDQFLRIELGDAVVSLENEEFVVGKNFAIVIPAGTKHNVRNTHATDPLQLYSLYSPPEHKDGTVHTTYADAQQKEEHFDGQVSSGAK